MHQVGQFKNKVMEAHIPPLAAGTEVGRLGDSTTLSIRLRVLLEENMARGMSLDGGWSKVFFFC